VILWELKQEDLCFFQTKVLARFLKNKWNNYISLSVCMQIQPKISPSRFHPQRKDEKENSEKEKEKRNNGTILPRHCKKLRHRIDLRKGWLSLSVTTFCVRLFVMWPLWADFNNVVGTKKIGRYWEVVATERRSLDPQKIEYSNHYGNWNIFSVHVERVRFHTSCPLTCMSTAKCVKWLHEHSTWWSVVLVTMQPSRDHPGTLFCL